MSAARDEPQPPTEDEYGPGPDQLPVYVPIARLDVLVRCQRCGSVVEGDVGGTVQHDVWHTNLDRRIAAARRGASQLYAGLPPSASDGFECCAGGSCEVCKR